MPGRDAQFSDCRRYELRQTGSRGLQILATALLPADMIRRWQNDGQLNTDSSVGAFDEASDSVVGAARYTGWPCSIMKMTTMIAYSNGCNKIWR